MAVRELAKDQEEDLSTEQIINMWRLVGDFVTHPPYRDFLTIRSR